MSTSLSPLYDGAITMMEHARIAHSTDKTSCTHERTTALQPIGCICSDSRSDGSNRVGRDSEELRYGVGCADVQVVSEFCLIDGTFGQDVLYPKVVMIVGKNAESEPKAQLVAK